MDPIRPIGPPERDLEPVLRVTRPSPDPKKEPRDQPEQPPRRRAPAPAPAPEQPPPDPDGPSLIDIRV
jgi:hypothetical protein